MSLFLSLIHADTAYTGEEEEWSDEFDDDADEATLGLIILLILNRCEPSRPKHSRTQG